MKKQKNVVKIIAVTIVALLIAIIVECIMFVQHGYSLTNSGAITTFIVMAIMAAIVILLSAGDWHFSNYGTIAAMMYYGIICLGGLLQVPHKSSGLGIFTQVLSVAGLFLCIYGIVLGVRQRELFIERKYHNQKRGAK